MTFPYSRSHADPSARRLAAKTDVPNGSWGGWGRLAAVALFAGLAATGCAHQSLLPEADSLQPPAQFAWQEELLSSGSQPLAAACSSLGSVPGSSGSGRSLADLQRELFVANYDLQAAFSRFEAAEARAREAGASLLPAVNAQLQVTRAPGGAFGAAAGISGGGISNSAVTTYQPSLAASWEIDVWGRLRNQKTAAVLDGVAALEDARSLGTSLSASLAELWFGMAAERALLEVLAAQQDASGRFLELVKLRFGQGFGGAQDIGRQQEQVLGLQGQIEQAQGRLRVLEAQAAALLGAFDLANLDLAAAATESAPLLIEEALAPLPEMATPLDLIGARPDVVAARRRLEAADRRLAAAVKQWLPSLTVTGTLFDFQRSLSALFEDLFWQVVGSVSQQVYAGGARAARIDQAQAAAEEALAAYASVLVTATSEVNASIAQLVSQREVLANFAQRSREAARVLDLTRSSYREGATDYLNVITALQSTQTLEQQLVDARRQQLANRVQLCRVAGLPSGVDAAPLLERLATVAAKGVPPAAVGEVGAGPEGSGQLSTVADESSSAVSLTTSPAAPGPAAPAEDSP